MVDGTSPRLDLPTLQHAVLKLEERLQAVVTYGAGGCASCHDAELRGAIAMLRRLMTPAAPTATAGAVATASTRRRR